MSTHRPNDPREPLSQGDLHDRMMAFGLGRARLLRAVAMRCAAQAVMRGAAHMLGRCGNALWTWQNRYNARRHMASLDARLRDDVGLTRADIARASDKPFWRA